MANKYSVELLGIDKKFAGVHALRAAHLQIEPGEVHALVGENGAGKSTLMKVLSGAIKKDNGKIVIDGDETEIHSPKDSMKKGISIIYQEFMLAPDLTVAENIFIDRLTNGGALINWAKLNKSATTLLSSLGFGSIKPTTKVADLSVAYQQIIEICKALSRNAKILIFDEPTAVLTFSEIEKLFGIIKTLKKQGVSVIYITHRLEEVFSICDRVTVMKDGEYVATFNVAETNKNALVSKMIGRELSTLFPQRASVIGDVVLEIENLNANKLVKDVSFKLRKGEILGFSGLVGSGRTETMRAIFGADKIDSGKIIYLGKEVQFKSPRQAVANKIGLLPEDRKKQGVLLGQSIRINTTLTSLKIAKNKINILDKKAEIIRVTDILAQLNTKYNSTEDPVSSLSGGNQQKVSLAKWLAAGCEVIILDEPTRGVDVGAKMEIYKNINDLAAKGVAIIMISSEMVELIGMCDRVDVMRHGTIVGELSKAELSEINLISLAMGV